MTEAEKIKMYAQFAADSGSNVITKINDLRSILHKLAINPTCEYNDTNHTAQTITNIEQNVKNISNSYTAFMNDLTKLLAWMDDE